MDGQISLKWLFLNFRICIIHETLYSTKGRRKAVVWQVGMQYNMRRGDDRTRLEKTSADSVLVRTEKRKVENYYQGLTLCCWQYTRREFIALSTIILYSIYCDASPQLVQSHRDHLEFQCMFLVSFFLFKTRLVLLCLSNFPQKL